MNIYAAIILATLVVSFIIDLITEVLNLKALRDDLPKEFAGVYDAEAYKKSQDYTRVKTKFGFITSIFSIILILVFWFAGGFNHVDTIVKNWGFHPIWTGLIYVGILIFAKSMLSLPFSIYSTFVIEERFGFNKTTPLTFVTDILKGLLLGVHVGGSLLVGVMAFFQYAGGMAWLPGIEEGGVL
ncbi:M48 family peptidase, partial [candidate division KSB1 bacterium]|nr:M48 family peptidase [candidate division KSB1 bacterium]